MKRCNVCQQLKPLDAFYAMKGMRDGYRNDCKDCNKAAKRQRYAEDPEKHKQWVREWQQANRERHLATQRARRAKPDYKLKERQAHLLRKFGISLEQYNEMLEAQGGVCGLCMRPPTEGISLAVDHDHSTGEIRGLLCFLCNNALGDFDDDAERLRAAASYLDRPDPEELALVRARVAELIASSRS